MRIASCPHRRRFPLHPAGPPAPHRRRSPFDPTAHSASISRAEEDVCAPLRIFLPPGGAEDFVPTPRSVSNKAKTYSIFSDDPFGKYYAALFPSLDLHPLLRGL